MVTSFILGWVFNKWSYMKFLGGKGHSTDKIDKNRAMAAVIAASVLKSSQDTSDQAGG